MGHALLSPSSASRWMACTPSARLESKYPNTSSVFADEGTLAHAYAEIFVRFFDDPDAVEQAIDEIQNDPLNEYYEFNRLYYSAELEEHARNFADYVLEQCTGDYFLAAEQRLDMTDWVEDGFGTGDAIVVKDGVLNLNDLKYGRGVKVSAVNNKQLMLYALGCIARFGWIYDFHTVRLHIYQPRIGNISVWSITVDELLVWAEEELKPKAALAYAGEGEQVAGEHCKFCKVAGECRALSEFSLEYTKDEWMQTDILTPEEIGEVFTKLNVLEIFINAVRDRAYSTILGGGKIPGLKIVKGKPSRYLKDPEMIRKTLLKEGFKEDQILTPIKERELLSLTALEKVVKKSRFTNLVGSYLGSRDGKPSLTTEDDPREEFIQAEHDWADEMED